MAWAGSTSIRDIRICPFSGGGFVSKPYSAPSALRRCFLNALLTSTVCWTEEASRGLRTHDHKEQWQHAHHDSSGFLLEFPSTDMWSKVGSDEAKIMHWIDFMFFKKVVIWFGTVCLIKMQGGHLDNVAHLCDPSPPPPLRIQTVGRHCTTEHHTSINLYLWQSP